MIVKLVEEHSGYPVQVVDDPNLTTFASIRLARRGGVPAHILVYRPGDNQAPDYFIAFQCGFALRLFAVPLEQRLETGMNKAGVQRVREDLEQTLRQNRQILTAGELEQVAAQMYGGLYAQAFDFLWENSRDVGFNLNANLG